jgi:large subunit ribosomal protein L16
MLLIPKKTKYRKIQKGRIQSYDSKASSLILGVYALIALESAYVKASQLEAARQTINRHLQRQGRVWTSLFPDLGVTKRPNQIRIGKGTGTLKYWALKVRPGRILFEVDGVPLKKAQIALASGAHKLPLKLKLIT